MTRLLRFVGVCWIAVSCFACVALGQTETATLSGLISDESGAVVPAADVRLQSVDRGTVTGATTNKAGIYVLANVQPGQYQITVRKAGFKQVDLLGIIINVQDHIEQNFRLQLGSVSESVTVNANDAHINTTDASVSTVVDQSYVKNMPLNGRSLQDLILLTPGIVTQSSQSSLSCCAGLGSTGEFSVNGQRAESNNYSVDGVSANLGATTGIFLAVGAGASGSLPGATALGTTQALVSVDDLQEFRVQSSTYSAEYGRNPGGQFAFETKSGANQWHGTAYDYLRNDTFDANDWFNDYLKVPEPPLRQNDFGGTLGGPVTIPRLYNGRDKTFFFASYEGLRLLQPQAASVNGVPDDCLRGTNTANCPAGIVPADPALQPILKAFPVANGAEFGDGFAEFKASWSNPSSIDSTSVRFDHVVGDKLRLFFRFSDTASDSSQRGTDALGGTPSSQDHTDFTMRTYTAGANSTFTSQLSNEFRLNYSSNETVAKGVISSFGGNTPVNLAQILGLGPSSNLQVSLCWHPGSCPTLAQGPTSGTQRQWNFVDTMNYLLGRHQLKFGVDFRRLTPFEADFNPLEFYQYLALFCSPVPNCAVGTSTQANAVDFAFEGVSAPAYPLYKNFSAFAEDEWKVSTRLNLSLGLRWDVNPPPGVTQGLMPYTVQGASPATWDLAPQGTPLWHTAWFNFAPRLGLAYRLRNSPGRETVLRTGGGLFFDTGQQLGSAGFAGPGFAGNGALGGVFGTPVSFPALPPPATVSTAPAPFNTPYVFPTHFQAPYTLQWNTSIEQALGSSQTITLSYVGARSGRLLQQDLIDFSQTPTGTNANGWTSFFYIGSSGYSNYHSAQAQYRRRLSRGFTALASYTLSHCIDSGSQNYLFGYQKGNCDYDVRHNASWAFSYDLPNVGHSGFVSALLRHWGLDNRFTARSGFPITLDGPPLIDPRTGKTLHGGLNWDPTQPLYVYGSNCDQVFKATLDPGQGCPGGRAINPAAFSPAVDSSGNPVRGNAPRNFVRGFGAWQMDLSVRREFPLHEQMKLQFRAEAFNVFNHPNFGAIHTNYCSPDPGSSNFSGGCNFGQPFHTLANSLGILNSLYQMGGARSMQFALKLVF